MLPFGSVFPAESGDPVLSADSGNGAIGVSGVVKHSDLALKSFVDPLRSLLLRVIDYSGLAKVPWLNIIWDVHSFAHLVTVHVVEELGAKRARWKLLECLGVPLGALNPWGVVSGRHNLLMDLIVVVQVRDSFSGLGVRTLAPADAKDIVDIHRRSEGVELIEELHALV